MLISGIWLKQLPPAACNGCAGSVSRAFSSYSDPPWWLVGAHSVGESFARLLPGKPPRERRESLGLTLSRSVLTRRPVRLASDGPQGADGVSQDGGCSLGCLV